MCSKSINLCVFTAISFVLGKVKVTEDSKM